jgi:hypothetical protein
MSATRRTARGHHGQAEEDDDFDAGFQEDELSDSSPPPFEARFERREKRKEGVGSGTRFGGPPPVANLNGSVLPPAGPTNLAFVPSTLNWLNVPDAVRESFVVVDRALVESRREVRRLEGLMRRMDERVGNLEKVNDKLVRAVRLEQEKSQQLAKDLKECQERAPNEDEIVQRAVEELRKAFHPEELRATLRKVEIASKQPQALARRIEALEQHKHSQHARLSATEHAKKAQRGRIEDAVSALRKLAL